MVPIVDADPSVSRKGNRPHEFERLKVRNVILRYDSSDFLYKYDVDSCLLWFVPARDGRQRVG